MIVTRDGVDFDVDDNDLSGDWGFWARFAGGTWEPEILDRLPELLNGGTYLDIGSWIGPQLLIASTLADLCVGFEPDPTAYRVLETNTRPLTNVKVHNAAITTRTEMVSIGATGNSMSQVGSGDHRVPGFTLADAVEKYGIRDVQLVKIDIEGLEQHVFPHAEDTLRSFNCPVFLSIHPWVTEEPDLTGWRVEPIARHEVLLWPV